MVEKIKFFLQLYNEKVIWICERDKLMQLKTKYFKIKNSVHYYMFTVGKPPHFKRLKYYIDSGV